MKRAAAIIGPTPSFVRWAIVYQCEYRAPVEENIPYEVFRQLRSLREVSLGLAENRVVENVCIHNELNKDSDTARGFPVNEITDIFGALETANACCGNCPANSHASSGPKNVLAGCYGWFFSKTLDEDLIRVFEETRKTNPSAFEMLPKAASAWHQVWQQQRWNRENIKSLVNVINSLPDDLMERNSEIEALNRAAQSCQDNDLELWTELIPRGHSDGVHWIVESHCPVCRNELSEEEKVCNQCYATMKPHKKARKKVLGLRPYMLLKSILGKERTEELLMKFRTAQYTDR